MAVLSMILCVLPFWGLFFFGGVASTYEVLAEDEIYRDQALEPPVCSDQV